MEKIVDGARHKFCDLCGEDMGNTGKIYQRSSCWNCKRDCCIRCTHGEHEHDPVNGECLGQDWYIIGCKECGDLVLAARTFFMYKKYLLDK